MDRKRTVAALVGGLLALGADAANAQKSPTAQAAYTRAQEHLGAKRFKEAAAEMETAVRFEPRFAMGWYVLASAQRQAGRCDDAVFAYRRYMELRPAEPDPYFGVGLCLRAIGDAEGATAAFRRYAEMDSRPASAEFVSTARRHVAELERAGAAGGTSKVAQGSPAPLMIEARDLRAHGRTEEAVARYRAAIAAAPRSAEAHVELGALLVAAKRPREAVDILRAAVRLDPVAATAWYNLAFATRESGEAAAAVEAYRRYITLRPKDPDPHYGLGRALASLGRDQEALSAFRTYAVLEARPTERKWLKKARQEIARIEAKAVATAATAPAPLRSSPAPLRSSPAPLRSSPAPLRSSPAPAAPSVPPPRPSAAAVETTTPRQP